MTITMLLPVTVMLYKFYNLYNIICIVTQHSRVWFNKGFEVANQSNIINSLGFHYIDYKVSR